MDGTAPTVESDIERKAMPATASREEWQKALEEIRVQEKALMRQHDALAASRRRLPMVAIDRPYELEGPTGRVPLLELFEGRNQLIVYHFMFHPDWDAGCDGCSWFVDGVADLSHLNARDVSFALVSRAPLVKLESYRQRMGWNLPWYSSFGTDFNHDFGATVGNSEHHALSVFLRDGDRVYLTYQTGARGVEVLGPTFSLLDLVPYGRQETWEDSPAGWPQGAPYIWWRRHDEYADGVPAPSVAGK